MKRKALRTCLFAGLALGLFFLEGCANPSRSTGTGPDTSPSKTYLIEYSARIQEDLEKLDELHEHQASTLVLTPETLDSSRLALRSFLDSLSEYQALLDQLGANPDDVDASDVRAALTRSEQVHEHLQEQALQLTLIGKVVDGEVNSGAVARSPDAKSRLAPSREYRQVFRRTAALAGSIDKYLETLHQKNLVPYSQVAHPAEGVFHFLRLHRLRDPRLETHARYFDGAWKTWIQSQNDRGRFEKAIAIFHLVMELAGRFHPDSLQPLSETVHASLEKPPEPSVVEAMEASLRAVEATAQSLRKTPPHWEAELQRITATLTLVRAYVAKEPGTRLSLALDARKQNPLLEKRVRTFVVSTAEAIGSLYLDSEQYEGAIAAFGRTLQMGTIPNRQRLSNHYRSLVFERGLKDAEAATREERFGSARGILEQLGRVAATPSEESEAKKALHSYYRLHVSKTLEYDPSAAVAIAEEMIKTFPSDTVAKRKLDDVLFGLLKKSVGDLETTHQRLGSSGVIDHLRATARRMVTNEGTAACQRFLKEIEDTWSRALYSARSGAEIFSIAFDIGRLKGESPSAARSSGARALAEDFGRAVVRKDWDEIEDCIDTHLSSCPSEARPPEYREVYLEFLSRLDRKGLVGKLGRHLAIFTTTFPDDVDRVRHMIVERMHSNTQEGVSFYALLKTIAPESEEVKAFEKEGRARDSDVDEDLRQLISDEDLAAARLQRQRTQIAAAPSGEPGDDPASRPEIGEETGGETPRPPPVRERRPVSDSSRQRGNEEDSGMVVLISGAGCSILMILLVLLTRSRGILAFRWYALAALWWGVTVGFMLGSPSVRAKLTGEIDARQGSTVDSSATVSTDGLPSVAASVGSRSPLPSPRYRTGL